MIYGPYKARVVKVHDGDTLLLDIDLGFSVILAGQNLDGKTLLSCRLFGINAPELNSDAGKLARDFLANLVATSRLVSVVSHGWDKYGGRFDGEVELEDGTNLSEAMVQSGNAVEKSYE